MESSLPSNYTDVLYESLSEWVIIEILMSYCYCQELHVTI